MTLEKYTSYKESGIERLGEIPKKWEISKIKNMFSFSKGLTITKDNLQEEGIYCINYGEIHSKYGFEVNPEIHSLKCVDESYLKSDPKSLLNCGDFIFADTSEDIEGSGNFTHLNSNIQTFAGYHTVICRPKKKTNYRFFAYLFDSTTYRLQIRKRVKGVKVYSITQGILKDTTLWLPPTEEQTKIASFLDVKTAQINEVIGQKEKLIALLKERKQIVINDAVTKGLDKDIELIDSGVEWIGKIPKHWELLANKYVFNLKKNVVGKKSNNYDLLSLTLEGIIKRDLDKGGKFPAEFDTYQKVKKDDFIFCLFDVEETPRTVGLSQYDGMITGAYTVFSVDDVNKDYLYYFYLNLDMKKKLRPLYKGLRNTISKDSFFSFKTFIPPKQEQLQIVEHIENQTTKIDKTIELQQNYITKLKEYKATLIDSVVTGKVRVA